MRIAITIFSFLAIGRLPTAGAQEARPPLHLSLRQAVEIALAPEGNARLRIAAETVRQSEARSAQSRAALLPHLEASVQQQKFMRNLEAFGIRLNVPVPGFASPKVVGPINMFDVRATLRQTIFDWSVLRNIQSSRTGVDEAKSEQDSTRDEIRETVARRYLAAVRADTHLATARSEVELAEALLRTASDQKEAGTGVGVEVTRARVQLAHVRQRLLAAENERRRTELELLRALGLPLDTPVTLADPLTYKPTPAPDVQRAVETALSARADWRAQQSREQSRQLRWRAVQDERLPSVTAFADYGSIGTSIQNAIPTRTYGVSLHLPIFDGGSREARSAEAHSRYRQEKIRTQDLRDQIELEIRLALDSLRWAEMQVRAAEEGATLATLELEQARRRYEAGMAGSLEATDAQTRLERARDDRLAALYSFNLAQIELAAAMGTLAEYVR